MDIHVVRKPASDSNPVSSKKFKITSNFKTSETCTSDAELQNLKSDLSTKLISFTNSNVLHTEENGDSSNKDSLETVKFEWRIITDLNLKLRYAKIFSNSTSKYIFNRLENEIEYFSGDLLKVRVYGKWHNIPRKQVAFGDDGLSYKFSGICLPSNPWQNCSIIMELKNCVEFVTGESFNFVLVNRYKDGTDHMGEHRDDEKDLVVEAPIASLSIGQVREFVFRHKDSRGKNSKLNIPCKKLDLESGSLLLMDYPTNKYWYHSLPVRKKNSGVRINLTFRKMVT